MISKVENDKVESKDPTTKDGIAWAKQNISVIFSNN